MSSPAPVTMSNLVSLPIRCYQKSFLKGDFLSLEPDLLWRLEYGFIRSIIWNYDGQAATLGIWGPGDTIGKILSQTEDCDLECLTPVMMNGLPLPRISSTELQEATLSHLQQSQTLLKILHCRPMPLRFLNLLNWLAYRFGHPVDRGLLLDLRLTHQTLAEIIGTTRVTITRMLGVFEREGKIEQLHQHRYLLNAYNISV
jgi:CRP-like cAMP-binding protein